MRLRLLPFAALLLAGFAAQDPVVEKLVESWPDGAVKVEREVRRDAEGEPVNHGMYASFHADGTPASEGKYRDGMQVGTWRTWHANGQLASKGLYTRGLRNQKWVYFDEAGNRDGGESGDYKAVFDTYADGTPESQGELRFNTRHGRWTFFHADGTRQSEGFFKHDKRSGPWVYYWRDGAVQLVGTCDRDLREGPWTFFHPNGLADPAFLSGLYEEGERVGPNPELAGTLPDADSPLLDLDALADPGPFPHVTDGDRREIERMFGRFLEGTEPARDDALEELAVWGPAALPPVLTRLKALDPAEDEELVGYRLHHVLLHALLNGHVFPWSSGTAPEDVVHNRLTVLRWFTLWEMKRNDQTFWKTLASVSAEEEPELLMWLPLAEGELDIVPEADATASTDSSAGMSSAERSRLVKRFGGEGTEKAVDLGLQWLAAHQSDVGAWDSDGYVKSCGKIDSGQCEGLGHPLYDVGVTSLALLAFLGAGNTTEDGDYQDVVNDAVAFLVGQQNRDSGLIGPKSTHEHVYGHALATIALGEAARTSGNPKLHDAVQRALDLILDGRNEGLGWRYGLPTVTGDNDTSVTAWMVTALSMGERHGFRVGKKGFEGALAWLDQVGEITTGRTGYDAVGSFSSRTMSNQQYAPDLGEAMTAAALLCRFMVGQEPSRTPMMRRQAALLLEKLPEWKPEENANDMYYWYYGTYAMFRMGGDDWKRWNAAVKEAALGSQRRDGDARGSWDPVGPWGYAGGRVYSTAILTLVLEVYYRG